MAQILKKITRKNHPIRLISSLTHQNPQLNLTNLNPNPFITHQSILNQLFPQKNDQKLENYGVSTHLSKLEIYPSFSLGYFLNPDLQSGSGLVDNVMPCGGEVEHPDMMWADSVKKKRKKKMNKHKFKKLRKRLRRKTKKT